MSSWTSDELATIGAADEISIAVRRSDGSLRRDTTVWVVRVGDQLFVRSGRGPEGAWVRAVQRRPDGRVRAGGLTRDVGFEPPTDVDEDAIDAAYRSKYGRHGGGYVDLMVGGNARTTTLRLTPT